MTAYAEKIIRLTVEIEKMEKKPDAFNDSHIDEIKVKIKQVEALIAELQLSIEGSTAVFESLRVEVNHKLHTRWQPLAACRPLSTENGETGFASRSQSW